MSSARVVLASHNAGKLRELMQLLAPRGFDLVLQSSLGIESIEETGTTFEANALLKARHAAARSGMPALADDSGIEVEALAGRPGVRSARYAGATATDRQNLERLLQALEGVPMERRGARYRCVIAFVRSADDPAPLLANGTWEGHITTVPGGDGGFGYDPIFMPRGSVLTAAQMSAQDKSAASHRGAALRRLLELLP